LAAQAAWSIEAGGVRLFVRLTPKSSRDALEWVEALSDGRLVFRARVRAIPEDGKANEALCKIVAKALGVSASSTRVTSGSTSRLKTLSVEGDARCLASKLEALATASRDG
jgi:uncharacterized protein YggU (UPF0235/DUF167 family)